MKSVLLVTCLAVLSIRASIAQSTCVSQEYRLQEMNRNYSIRQQIERAENSWKNASIPEMVSGTPSKNGDGLTLIKIPVVVHILYNNADQNISDAQVLSQIEILNKEFRRLHADTSFIPLAFRNIAADCRIEFALANITPKGYATTGIVRKQTNSIGFGFDDKIKFSSSGGDDGWDSDRYLNIWVGRLYVGIQGYASPLGGPKEKDGVVVSYTAFGNTGQARAPYNKGRITVHEIGHWLGLRHIWGDQYCGNDEVGDTPPQGSATRGCPAGVIVSCNNAPTGNMYNNYMDLTDDNCMNMFTIGQRERMRAAFLADGPRRALLFSNGASGIPLPEPPPPEPIVEKKLSIFPNPGSDKITVDLGDEKELTGSMLTIFNQLGQMQLQVRITGSRISIDISHLKEGIYFVKTDKKTKPIKLIKGNNPIPR
jgi:hypothetical protein